MGNIISWKISSMINLQRALLVMAGTMLSAIAWADQGKTFGWLEKVTLEPWGVEVKAKLDSGALTSSLDARDIEHFEKDGQNWIRFRLELENEAGGGSFSKVVERKAQRKLVLRGAGGTSRRPTVLMKICVGDRLYEEEFSLRNRNNMLYPILLGRSTIAHLGALDVEKTFLRAPECDNSTLLESFQPKQGD